MATEKIPIRTVYDGATAVGLAEYQATEVVGVTYGGIGTNTLTSNSILLGNGTSALQSSSIQIIGTTLSSSDSSTININEGLTVEGNLIVTGSITGTIANTSLTNSSFTLADDTSSTTTISLGETLKIAGGSGVDTLISGDTLTISLESTIVTETSTDTLTNKSISLSTNTITGTLAEFNTAVSNADLASLSGSETLTNKTLTTPIISSISNTGTLTLPTSTDTLVGKATTDTLTNKSISLSTNTITGTLAEFNTAVSDADLVSLAGSETLTNKTISGGSNTISNIGNSSLTNSNFTLTDDSSTTTTISLGETLKIAGGSGIDTSISGDTLTIALESTVVTETSTDTLTNKSINLNTNTITGTIALFNTALSDADFATLAGSETLTNKTISGSSNTISNIGNSSLTNSGFTLADDTSSTTTISLGETLKISGTSNEIETAISGDTITIGLPSNVTIGSNLTVGGDLTVNGTTTTINSTTLSVDDKNIELASVATPTDVTADGAGITIKGATDKTFNWLDATDSFTSSEHIDLASTKVFKINNSTVLSSTQVLGKSVPSGTIVGTSDSQTLTTKTISGSDNTITNISNSSLTNSSFTIVDDTSTTSTISLGEALLLAGGTGITSVITGDTVTFNIDSTVTTLTGTQTLTNKTLTTPIISSISNSGTITLPTSTDTLVGRATTDTLTNKTFTSPKINEDVAVTATATELNYTDGVTSAIQTQLDAKASRSFAIAQAVALG